MATIVSSLETYGCQKGKKKTPLAFEEIEGAILFALETDGVTLLAFDDTEGATLLALEETETMSKLSPLREISITESESSPGFLGGREVKVPKEVVDAPMFGLKILPGTGNLDRFQAGCPSVVVGVSSILKSTGRGMFRTPSGARGGGKTSFGEASGSVFE